MLVLLPVVFGDPRRGALRRALGNPVAVWLGLVSYGIYLWHGAVVLQLERWRFGDLGILPPVLLWAAGAVAGTAVLAAASYYLVERPALSLKGRFGRAEPAAREVAEPAPAAPATMGRPVGHQGALTSAARAPTREPDRSVQSTAAASAGPSRFVMVDSLRGLAALGVIFVHAVGIYGGGATLSAAIRPYVLRLDVVVPVFFLISAFVLYRPFVRARLRGGSPPATGPYAWGRVLRIVPAYWVALTVAALALGLGGVLTLSGVPTYHGFAQIYRSTSVAGGIPVAWTLCIEVTFYAFLPLWALAMRRLGRRSAERRFAGELGALAALAAASVAYKLALLWTGAVPALVPSLEPNLIWLPAYTCRLLANRVLVYLGTISFGLYPYHLTVLALLQRWGLGSVEGIHPYLLWGLPTLALSVVLGSAELVLDRASGAFAQAARGPAGRARGRGGAGPCRPVGLCRSRNAARPAAQIETRKSRRGRYWALRGPVRPRSM